MQRPRGVEAGSVDTSAARRAGRTVRIHERQRSPTQRAPALQPLLNTPGDPIADDVLLVASELVTNTVQNSDDGGVMQAWDPKPGIPFRLEVDDNNPTIPAPRKDLPEMGGHGLRLVENLSDSWGINQREHGKTIWAEFVGKPPTRTTPPERDAAATVTPLTGQILEVLSRS